MFNNMSLIVNDTEYLLSYIIEPKVKVYFNDFNDDKVICSKSILSSRRFLSSNSAKLFADFISKKFDIDFSIEKVEV